MLRDTDPSLYAKLKQLGAEDCMFTYRWDQAVVADARQMLHNWLAQAGDDEERAQRAALLESDPHAAWRRASNDHGPRFNTDGTPMLPGYSNVDVHGSLYGMPDHTSPVYNSNTDTFSVPGNAYSSPLDS